jgi:membrane-associated phospholipid phosphatase
LNRVSDWDHRILQGIDTHRTGWADGATRLVMYVGTTPWTLVVGGLVALALVVRLRAYREAVAGIAALVVAVAASEILKAVFDRARPPSIQALVYVDGHSFPSTQASATAALTAAVLLARTWSSRQAARRVATVLVALDVVVGVCMVYLGAHWTSDVLAGWVLGAIIGVAFGRFARRSTTTPTPR